MVIAWDLPDDPDFDPMRWQQAAQDALDMAKLGDVPADKGYLGLMNVAHEVEAVFAQASEHLENLKAEDEPE
jgi:hypothetical protein